jgi:hypothetical protein
MKLRVPSVNNDKNTLILGAILFFTFFYSLPSGKISFIFRHEPQRSARATTRRTASGFRLCGIGAYQTSCVSTYRTKSFHPWFRVQRKRWIARFLCAFSRQYGFCPDHHLMKHADTPFHDFPFRAFFRPECFSGNSSQLAAVSRSTAPVGKAARDFAKIAATGDAATVPGSENSPGFAKP